MHFSTILSSTFIGAALAVHPAVLLGQLEALASQPSFAGAQHGLRARDLAGLTENDISLYARDARGGGGGRPSASRIASGVSNGAGNIGTALTGVSNFVDLFRHHPQQKRDLENLENLGLEIVARDVEDGSIYVRAAKGGGGGGRSRPSAASIGRGVNSALNGAGNVGTALTGVSDFVNLFKGGKRDLESLDYDLYAREEDFDME